MPTASFFVNDTLVQMSVVSSRRIFVGEELLPKSCMYNNNPVQLYFFQIQRNVPLNSH